MFSVGPSRTREVNCQRGKVAITIPLLYLYVCVYIIEYCIWKCTIMLRSVEFWRLKLFWLAPGHVDIFLVFGSYRYHSTARLAAENKEYWQFNWPICFSSWVMNWRPLLMDSVKLGFCMKTRFTYQACPQKWVFLLFLLASLIFQHTFVA